MKLSCEIVQDLMPLLEDDVCSEQSRRAIEEHLQECEKCRRLIACTEKIPTLITEPARAADKVVVKSFKKVHRRWWISLLLVILLVPACVLGWNQYCGQGASYTNLHEIYIGNAFMSQLQKRNYEEAFRYVDIERLKETWLEEWFDEETLADIEDDGMREFREAASMLEEVGGIEEFQYIGIKKDAFCYRLIYTVLICGEEHQVTVGITDDGVRSFLCEGSFLDDPFAHFGMWSEYLWQFYEGCYYDPDLKQYVYYDAN